MWAVERVGTVEAGEPAGREKPGVVATVPVRRGGRWTLAPGWLVHAGLKACRTAGLGCAFLDGRRHVLPQLAVRVAFPARSSSTEPLLEGGLPVAILTDQGLLEKPVSEPVLDAGRLSAWTSTVSTLVRRLDTLAGRPRGEDRYWVWGDRVWLRRDLYWVALPIWIALVVGGHRRARRRGETASTGAFLYRLGLLLSFVAVPVLSLLFLLPSALAVLTRPRSLTGSRVAAAVGLAIPLALGASLAASGAAGQLAGWGLSLLATMLLGSTLAAFLAWLLAANRS